MGFSALAPIAHMALLNTLQRTMVFLEPMVPSLCSYFFGLWFYANHYPESRFPGVSPIFRSRARSVLIVLTCPPSRNFPEQMFDIFGASHNVWHFSIVAAIAFHFRGVMQLYQNKDVYSPASATVFSSHPGGMSSWLGLAHV